MAIAGVRQGCILSPFLFLLVTDIVMKNTIEGKKRRIQWSLMERLIDLDFADDVCLLTGSYKDAQTELEDLRKEAQKYGLILNKSKTKTMHLNTKKQDPIFLENIALEDVNGFTYLGSIVTKHGGVDEDVKQCIKANEAFIQLYPIWKSKIVTTQTELRIFRSTVKSVLLYGSESWKVTNQITNRLHVFVNRYLRRILNIYWPETISNEELRNRAKEDSIKNQIRRRKWNWIGHTVMELDRPYTYGIG